MDTQNIISMKLSDLLKVCADTCYMPVKQADVQFGRTTVVTQENPHMGRWNAKTRTGQVLKFIIALSLSHQIKFKPLLQFG